LRAGAILGLIRLTIVRLWRRPSKGSEPLWWPQARVLGFRESWGRENRKTRVTAPVASFVSRTISLVREQGTTDKGGRRIALSWSSYSLVEPAKRVHAFRREQASTYRLKEPVAGRSRLHALGQQPDTRHIPRECHPCRAPSDTASRRCRRSRRGGESV
jgi:hypothetical protein